jgi:hypothetical protein
LLGFYLDSALTIPATLNAPKKFLVPLKGGTKTTTVYLGDPYATVLANPATAGAATLTVDDTSEFLASGSAAVGTQTVTYTGLTSTTLTGVTGLAANATAGTVVRPLKKWFGTQPIVLYSAGTDKNTLNIAMREHGAATFNYPGMPLIMAESSVAAGPTPLAIDIQVAVPAGALQEFTDWNIESTILHPRNVSDSTAPTLTEVGYTFVLACYALRRDQQLGQRLRVLPLNRSILSTPPGFVWGQYRWRDKTQVNQHALIPSNWEIDPNSVGSEKFIAGIGAQNDLEPVGLVQENDSIHLQVKRGHYFTGINRYFLPATPQFDVLDSSRTALALSKTPTKTFPIFVGTYKLDSQGYYEADTVYRYQTAAAVARGTSLPDLYYTLDRTTNAITLNKPMATQELYLGSISGESTDYFPVPVYPVGQVLKVYAVAAFGTPPIIATNWSFDPELGQITVASPSGSGVSVVGSSLGMSVFATCTPAVAALYETDDTDTLTVDSVDLNPAFAGLASGTVYLAQTRQQAASLVLSCDKPQIPIPATLSSIIGLIAYGPVYFNNDYALLQVQAYSGVQGEVASNTRLKVIVDSSTFTGLINYLDPLTTPIEVVTGADGIANLIFTPKPNYGVYIPSAAASGSLAGLATTTITDDTVVLPQPVPISQIWDSSDGWMVSLYVVHSDNPVFGKVGADTGAGEVAFATSGTPGTVGYKTNGYLQPWPNFTSLYTPVQALDAAGNNYTSSSFSGNVVKLVYGQALPVSAAVAAYFLTFLQRSVIQMQEVDSDVMSNSIMLQMQMPPLIDDSVWLILNDSAHGILNQYRLGISASS